MVLLSVKKTANLTRTWQLMDFLAARAYLNFFFFFFLSLAPQVTLLPLQQ